MIPKKIHYIWFGGNPKNDLIKRCIASWKQYMPDYEIIEWNENNADLSQCSFAQDAYQAKKWAYVSDYVRFKVLAEQGGVYMDTDVELLKPIPENILAHTAFTGLELNGTLSPGCIYGCISQDPIAVKMVAHYQEATFDSEHLVSVNDRMMVLLGKDAPLQQKIQVIEGLSVYPWQYFSSYDQDVKEICIKPESIAVHHYLGTWVHPTLKRRIQNVLKKHLGVEGYRKVLHGIRKIRRK